MKTWKIAVVAIFALAADGLITDTAFAYTRGQGNGVANGSYAQGYGRGMMRGYDGGMMGFGYSQYSQYSNYTVCNDSPYESSSGGCALRNCCP